MGSIVAVLGEAGDSSLEVRVDRMLARSPYRGIPRKIVEGPLAIGIQSLGWDASLASVKNRIIAFHGYIGNWEELAYERSWRFRKRSTNAEKMAVAYDDLGDRLFPRLRGEWALLIWDRRERTMLAVRDFVGCRPMFWQRHRGILYLSSEIRQVLAGSGSSPVFSWDYADRFVEWRQNLDLTAVESVSRMVPGHLVRIRGCSAPSSNQALLPWTAILDRPTPADRREATAHLRDLVKQGVKRSAVGPPSSVAVSGGLDSSAVWVARTAGERTHEPGQGRLAAVSLRFPGHDCDEGEYIEALLGRIQCQRVEVPLRPEEIEGRLRESSGRVDSLCLANIMCQNAVAQASSALGIRVILTGHGGDLLFTGSLRSVLDALMSRPDFGTVGTAFQIVARNPGYVMSAAANVLFRNRGSAHVSQAKTRGARWTNEVELERSGWVLDPWEQVASSCGTEIRHPLLDLDLLTFCVGIPQEWHSLGGLSKGLLRAAFRSELPPAIAKRRSKVSLDNFLMSGLGSIAPRSSERRILPDGWRPAEGNEERDTADERNRKVLRRMSQYPGLDIAYSSLLGRIRGGELI